MALRERVYSILVEANGGDERMTSLGASECLYNAGLGLRYVQVRNMVGVPCATETEEGYVREGF